MPQTSRNTTAHTPAYAAASMSMTHPSLVWSQMQEQKQLKKSTLRSPTTTQSRSSSAASVLSQSTTYSYDKGQSTPEPKSLFQRIKELLFY
ncbi:hypothetical protein HD806DRAFT_479722 [Xylariaceae sp. AK1471]|nr:hypothetical protein HD806DRAFT_479722 [Xylariaceae sp. AK1471]